jgi:hypothetical protein
VQYADGTTEDVVIRVADAVVEAPITLKGPARRLTVRNDITPVEIVR